jgi:NAD(P)-dependent dehydrogenase (short-subunit alcohol dehydrogenase family)
MMMVAADELGPSSVRVNGIRPGLIRTEMVEPIFQTDAVRDDYLINTPLARAGEVEDIAMMALFLLSDAAGFITGQVINVDGGISLRRGPDFSGLFEPMFGAEGLRGVVS